MKGSVTIETSVIMMLFIFIFVGTVSLTVSATEKIRETSELYIKNCQEDLREREAAQWMRKFHSLISGMEGEEENRE
ncbi:MAG: hypothetical protein E7269_07185 [Lachnospiraceae bacterium]|nr:hypothetical protein [Lachnospiraceae bacterium]